MIGYCLFIRVLLLDTLCIRNITLEVALFFLLYIAQEQLFK
nr:MAG TPA_asm: hypothetical protein [Bacteriophage sp.]